MATKAPSLASQVSRAVVWNALFVPLRLLAEVAATFFKLNTLAPAAYGLLALISGINNGLGNLIDLGTQRALPKYVPETNRAGGKAAMLRFVWTVFSVQMGLLLLAVVGLLVFHGPSVAYLRSKIQGDLPSPVQQSLLNFVQNDSWFLLGVIVALLFLGVCYDMLMAYLSSFFRQRAWNTVALAAGVLQPMLIVAALVSDLGLTGVLVATVAAPAIAVALALWSAARFPVPDARPADAPPLAAAGRFHLPTGFVRYSGVSLLMTMTDYIASRSFVIFLVPNLQDVAVLTAGASVVTMVLGYLFTPMAGVQVPLFTRVRAGEGGTLLGAYQSLVRLQVLLIVPGGVGLVLLAAPVLHVLAPTYGQAAPLVWVLTPCLFLECLLTTAHNALIVHEKLRIIVFARVLALIVVPLVLALTPSLGVLGAALGFGLARVLSGAWVTANGFRLLGLRWPWQFTARVCAAAAAMGAAVAALRTLLPALHAQPTALERLQVAALIGGMAVAGAAVFLLVLRLAGGLDPRDREQLLKMKLPLKRWITRLI